VDDFNQLIEAAKRGDEEDVISLVQRNSELINQRDEVGLQSFITLALVDIARQRSCWWTVAPTSTRETPAGWAIEYLRELGGFLAIEMMTLLMQLPLATLSGSDDTCDVSLSSSCDRL
jgi:hypothetical protein